MTEITVQYVNFPREGKKRGSIKTSEGQSYWCLPALLREFQVGEVCKIEFTTNDQGFHQLNKKIWNGQDKTLPPKQIARPRMDPADARGAFITVILEAFVRAGKVPLNKDAIATAREEIGYGYDQSHNPQRRDDMNDEIPNWPRNSENPAE
jgi:hypothetical protein